MRRPSRFETDDPEHALELTFRTYADPRADGILAGFASVLAEFGVEVIDDSMTPKRVAASAFEGLEHFRGELIPGDTVSLNVQRWSEVSWWGMLKLATVAAFRLAPVGQPEEAVRSPQRPTELELILPRSVWGDAAGLERLGDLVVGLAEAVDGAHAKVVWQPMEFQHLSCFELDRSVSDIGWLNYFGPAYVKAWGGISNLVDLGLYNQRTANGGIVIWTTEAPYVLERSVRNPRRYGWKQDLIERVGEFAFFEGGDYGEYVPDERTQRRFARQVEDDRSIATLLSEPIGI